MPKQKSFKKNTPNENRQRQPRAEADFLWLISFSDLLLLLFVFFVVLFSFSYQKLTASEVRKMQSSLAQTLTGTKIAAPKDYIDDVQSNLSKWLTDRKLFDVASIEKKDGTLVLQIKEKILFESGEYTIKEGSKELISAVSKAISTVPKPYKIGIEGHTDDVPVRNRTGGISDNWDLSAKRALEVLKAMQLPIEIKKRTVVMGFGEMNPLAPNRTVQGQSIAENQMLNRRVTIRVY